MTTEKYAKPTLGRNFNVTNCTEYTKSVVVDLTHDTKILLEKNDVSLNDLSKYKKISVHLKYLQKFQEQLAKGISELTEIHKATEQKLKSTLASSSFDSKNWSDIDDFDVLKKEVVTQTAGGSGSRKEIESCQQHPDGRFTTASGSIECLPASLDIDGIYEMTRGGATWRIPKIRDLATIPPAFYYFEGDDMYERGAYICMSPGIYIHIPDVRVISECMGNSKHRTSPCKDGLDCKNYECTYAHPGTPFIKLGIAPRCPGNPGFGDKESYGLDISGLVEQDARMLLLYSLTDLFPLVSWLQKHKDPKIGKIEVISNLHLCEPDRS